MSFIRGLVEGRLFGVLESDHGLLATRAGHLEGADLAGLLEKGAARLQTNDPKVYRATRPEDLIAELGRESVARIERLQGQFAALGAEGASSLHEFAGTRELVELAIRLAARDADVVRFLGSGATARSLAPVWRKRDQDGLETTVIATSDPGDLPVSTVQLLEGPTAAPWSSAVPAILSTSDASIVGVETADGPQGVWGSTPALVSFARSALQSISS